jgi:hypothetical protein
VSEDADLKATTYKTCTKCGETRALERFELFAQAKRRRSWCIACRRAYNNTKAAEHRFRAKAVRDAFNAKRVDQRKSRSQT